MGRRSEQRIVISFPVIVHGVDRRGAKFKFIAKTLDISFSGARLKGLPDVVAPGSKIELECRDERAQYRVVWAGRPETPEADCVGVRCLEMGKYIWGVPPKEWEPDTYDAANEPPPESLGQPPQGAPSAVAGGWTGTERRQFARHLCRIEAIVAVQDDSVEMPGKITDISLGGCYVEMLSPLPDGTPIRITLSPAEGTLRLSGKVCSSQHGFGMGVAFTGMGPDDFEKLRRLAPPAGEAKPAAKIAPSRPPQSPAPNRESRVLASARSYAPSDEELDLAPTSEAMNALIRLLLRKEIFTRGELAEELEKAKIIQR